MSHPQVNIIRARRMFYEEDKKFWDKEILAP